MKISAQHFKSFANARTFTQTEIQTFVSEILPITFVEVHNSVHFFKHLSNVWKIWREVNFQKPPYIKSYTKSQWYLLLAASYVVIHRCNIVEFVSLWWQGRCFLWFIIQDKALYVTSLQLVINGSVVTPENWSGCQYVAVYPLRVTRIHCY